MQKYIRTLSLILTSSGFALASIAAAQTSNNLYEKDTSPIVRYPPIMPSEAKTSGYCCMVFDISKTGTLENIKANYCTNEVFAEASKEAASKWQYSPAENKGKPVIRKGVATTMSFRLTNSWGVMIPSQTGYLSIRKDRELTPPPGNSRQAYSDWIDETYVTEMPCGDLVS